jgi:hypothetical protein
MNVRRTLDSFARRGNLRLNSPASRIFLTRMQRSLQPELLDSLPHDHPDALHNRRDLRLINALLRNHAWLVRTVQRVRRPGETLLEIGAGTGELVQRFKQRGIEVAGLDLWPKPADWPQRTPWHRADLKNFDGYPDYSIVVGNLIYHQFSDAELAALGARLRSARVLVACEPQRRRVSQILFRTIAPLFGANHVSLHDAHVSIAAGFRGRELADTLGLDENEWDVRTCTTLLGIQRLLAIKRP